MIDARRVTTLFIVLIVSSVFVNAVADKVVLFDLNIGKDDLVQVLDVRIYEGSVTVPLSEFNDYSLELLSFEGEVLHKLDFPVSFQAVTARPPGKEYLEPEAVNSARVLLKLPYLTNAVKYRIKHFDQVIYESDLNLCNNNGKCEVRNGENFLSCSSDCLSGSKDSYCDAVFDNLCDPDCEAQGKSDRDVDCTCGNDVCDLREDGFSCQVDCGAPENLLSRALYIVGGVVVGIIVIIILVIFLLVRHHHKKKRFEK